MSEKLDASAETVAIDAVDVIVDKKPRIVVGSLVRLNSGSPCLTVENVTPGGKLQAKWFGDDGIYRQIDGPPECFYLCDKPKYPADKNFG